MRNVILIFTLILLSCPLTIFTHAKNHYEQEIKIDIDTSRMRLQPVDVHVTFRRPCWAVNETIHSVKLLCKDSEGNVRELESQIYNLGHIDRTHISSCNLVFLIPSYADGKERYFVTYSDTEVTPPKYIDHVDVEDCHYFYEPIPGQKIDVDYYMIREDGYIIYGICQEGEILGEGASQTIVKMKPNSTKFETVNADQFASFAMFYSTSGKREFMGTSLSKKVRKSILVDGNLMVRVRIECISPHEDIETDNVYTYYYCPTACKRIFIHANHRILKDITVGGNNEIEGTYATLTTFRSRSATIDKMNVGNILPYLHFYSRHGIIKEYSIPTNPSSENSEWILSTEDDEDLGERAWFCVDDPSTGKTHAVIFASNKGISKETDGIQIKVAVKQVVKLPGLEADCGNVYAVRNAYNGKEHDLTLEKGTNISFDAEFVSFEKEGFEAVDRESVIYRDMKHYRQITVNESQKGENKERFSITAYVHFAPSFPFGTFLSALTGKKFSYIYAEIYRGEKFVSSGSMSRLPIGKTEVDFKNHSFFRKIKSVIAMFDWKNFSIYKKITFPGLEEGRYLIKVYRENARHGGREFVGFKLIDLKSQNKKVHIFCKPEAKVYLHIDDQHHSGVEGVECKLLCDGITISNARSDRNGNVLLKVPSGYIYQLIMIYKGFVIRKEELRLGFKEVLFPAKLEESISLYTFRLKIKDAWGLEPAIDLYPVLTSEEMEFKEVLTPEKEKKEYVFNNLYPANYTLRICYKSFTMEKSFKLSNDTDMEITFPANYTIKLNLLNSRALALDDGKVFLYRDGKVLERKVRAGKASMVVPPGCYKIDVVKGKTIARTMIDVEKDKELTIVTENPSGFHDTLALLSFTCLVASLFFFLWKRDNFWIGALIIFLLIISLISPWWVLVGGDGEAKTITSVIVLPPNMLTFISHEDFFSGEINRVSPIFTQVLSLTSILIIASCSMLLLGSALRRGKTFSYLLFGSLILIVISMIVFLFTMYHVSKVSVGSLFGEGCIEISLPTGEVEKLHCKWGLGTGFYLTLLASCAIFLFKKLK